MNTTNDYLDLLKAKTGAVSDYALAPKIGLSKQMISRYRQKKDFFSDDFCLIAASILEIDPAIVLASIHAEKAKGDKEKAIWKGIFEKLGGIAASVTLGIMLNQSLPSKANADAGYKSVNNKSDLYIIRSNGLE